MEGKDLQNLLTPRPIPVRERAQRTMTDPNRYRANNRLSSLGCNYVFAPRPFLEVFTERAYLVSSFQLQDVIRKQLTEQYLSVTDQLSNFETPKQRRRLRKKISQLKPQIAAAAEAQKAVYLRLCEVEIEMQSLQTMIQAHAQTLHLREWPSPGPTLASFSTTSDASSSLSTCTTPLVATSPVFIPKRELLEPQSSPEPHYWPSDTSPCLATVDEAGEDCSCNYGLQYSYRSLDTLRENCVMSWDGATEELQLKRSPSLPNMQYAWPTE